MEMSFRLTLGLWSSELLKKLILEVLLLHTDRSDDVGQVAYLIRLPARLLTIELFQARTARRKPGGIIHPAWAGCA